MSDPGPAPAPVLTATAGALAPADLARAVEALRAGRAVVYPTETLYGLGARALDPAAVAGVQALKGRPDGKPFPLLVADRAMLAAVAERVPPLAEALAERHWPGALTLVLPARAGLPPGVVDATAGRPPTVAVRVSPSPVARALVEALGEPLVATSANRSGEPAPRTAPEAAAPFGDRVALVIDAGALPGRRGSTIVDATGPAPRILRAGDLEVDLAGLTGVGEGPDPADAPA